MTVPANTAKATKRWKAQVGTDEYQGHTSGIDYDNGFSGTTWKGGDGNTLADIVPGDPSITFTLAQDTENPDSLWRLLHDSPVGTQFPFIWYPHYGGTFALSTVITTFPPKLVTTRAGGIPEISITLPCTLAETYTGP